MSVLAIVLAVVDIVLGIALVFLVIFQEGNDRGMGIIGGGSDTFFSKEKGRSQEQTLKKLTSLLAICFAVITVVLYLILANGY